MHWNTLEWTGIALECTGMHWKCSGIAVELHWELMVSIPPQQMFHLQGHSLHGIFVLLEMLHSEICLLGLQQLVLQN